MMKKHQTKEKHRIAERMKVRAAKKEPLPPPPRCERAQTKGRPNIFMAGLLREGKRGCGPEKGDASGPRAQKKTQLILDSGASSKLARIKASELLAYQPDMMLRNGLVLDLSKSTARSEGWRKIELRNAGASNIEEPQKLDVSRTKKWA